MFEQGDLFKFDLKSGYHHADTWPEQYKYLGLHWDLDGMEKYVFKILPFGLSTACFLFNINDTISEVLYWHGRDLKLLYTWVMKL